MGVWMVAERTLEAWDVQVLVMVKGSTADP